MARHNLQRAVHYLGHGNSLLPFPVATMLLFAAAQKSNSLIAAASYQEPSSSMLNGLAVAIESTLALLLTIQIRPTLIKNGAMAWLIILFATSTTGALAGIAECHCFGNMRWTPARSLAVTAISLLLLWCWRPTDQFQAIKSASRLACLLVVTATLYAAIAHSRAAFHDNSASAFLQPKQWTGKPFPLLQYIDIKDTIGRGDWHLLLFRHDCPHCMGLLATYPGHRARAPRPMQHLAFIEIPPLAVAPTDVPPIPHARGKLSTQQDWFIEAPLCIDLLDGVVISVQEASDL